MAISDATYKFVAASIGDYGSHSDGGVFKNSPIGQALEDGELDLPSPTNIPGSDVSLPFVFVGDEAFQLRPDFMRPYPGGSLDGCRRIFNYRLSRARLVIWILNETVAEHYTFCADAALKTHLVFLRPGGECSGDQSAYTRIMPYVWCRRALFFTTTF